MPRAGRTFDEGLTYHVYNRVGGGLMPFSNDDLAGLFVHYFRTMVERHEVQVLGWCLLGNHYHLILRQGPVSPSHTMMALQQKITKARNARDGVYGPLWQGRFKAKEISSERYLLQLVAYVHLNPVSAGLVDHVDDYRWSGHREIIARRKNPIVAVDDVLLLYGDTRRTALRNYRSALAATVDEDWCNCLPGQLPWWRLGRPTKEDRERLRRSREPQLDMLGRSTAPWRPEYSAEDWIELACKHLGVSVEELVGRGRSRDVVTARDLIGLVGIERYHVKVIGLAQALDKSRDGVSRWARRGAIRRKDDPSFADAAEQLDRAARENR